MGHVIQCEFLAAVEMGTPLVHGGILVFWCRELKKTLGLREQYEEAFSNFYQYQIVSIWFTSFHKTTDSSAVR